MNLQFIKDDIPASDIPCYEDKCPSYLGFSQHTHTRCEMIYVVSGKLINSYANGIQILHPHQLIFIRSDDLHSTLPFDPSDIDIFTIGIPNILMNNLLKCYELDLNYFKVPKDPPLITLSNEEHTVFSRDLKLLTEMPNNKSRGYIMTNLLSNAVFYLLSHSDDTQSKLVLPNWFSDLTFKMTLPENFLIGLPKLREISNYSDEYINRCFKKYLSVTPTEYINNLRLDYAVELLKKGDKNILDVCLESGFKNEGHFYKLFKKRYNMSPRKFDKELMSDY